MRRGLLLVAALGAAGCIPIRDRIARTDIGGPFTDGLQAVLMVNRREVNRGSPLVLNFAIKNGGRKEVRVAKSLSRDSGWAGLILIGPDGDKPPYQDVLLCTDDGGIGRAYLRKKETVLLDTGDVHVVTWVLSGEETRKLQNGYHSVRGAYIGVHNPNRLCDSWWTGRLESNQLIIRVR